MPKHYYKLVHLNNKGRAEITRLLFAQAGEEYEDSRIQESGWQGTKNSTPTGTLPMLVIDAKMIISQSQAIARYVAREFNLCGDDNIEMLKCDMVLEYIMDIWNDTSPIYDEQKEDKKADMKRWIWNDPPPIFDELDEDKKAEMKVTIFKEIIKPKFKYLENILIKNGGQFFVGNKITVADIGLLAASTWFCLMLGDHCFNDFPKLTANIDMVAKEPRIAEWIAKRPDTPL